MKNPKREWILKVGVFIVCLLLLMILHWIICEFIENKIPLQSYKELFRWNDFGINLTHIENSGAIFGFFSQSDSIVLHGTLAFISFFVAFVFFIFLIKSIPWKYSYQFFVLSVFIGSRFAVLGDRIRFGFELEYFDIYYSNWHWPTFNIIDLAFAITGLLLYGFVVLRYFRVLPRFKNPKSEYGAHGKVADPLYDRRWPLKFILSIMIFSYILLIFIMVVAAIKGEVFIVDWLFAIASGIIITIMWRLIPTRPVDVIVLRSFQSDRKGWITLRSLRQKSKRALRITGVVDPKGSRRLVYLYFWLVNPFMFAFGDFARPDAFKHNIFLEGNWKDGIQSVFSSVRTAVFDCGKITSNLIWEIRIGMKTLGPEHVFFLTSYNISSDELKFELAENQLDAHTIQCILNENCFHDYELSELVCSLKRTVL